MSMKKTASNNRSLPEEIIDEILSWLPVKTLLRFKSASKMLLNLIIRPEFVKLHQRRSLMQNPSVSLLYWNNVSSLASFDFNQPQCPAVQLDTHPDVIKLFEPPFPVEIDFRFHYMIIGVCNGVVCFRKAEGFVLYNPATRAYKQVPRQHVSSALYFDEFAYDCISDDFKIFSYISYFVDTKMTNYPTETCLYNLKDNSWLKIENPPHAFNWDLSFSHVAHNSLYWISSNTFNYDEINDIVIMRFDLSSHRYEEILLPIQVMFSCGATLMVLNGRVHIMTQLFFGFDIWMLNEDNCLTKVFHCSASAHTSTKSIFLLPYAYSKDRRKIIVGNLEKLRNGICCDLESQTTSVVHDLSLDGGIPTTAIPWVESLVPLAHH